MLYLVGLGISDETDVSIKAIDILMGCDRVFCEMFTSIWHGDMKKLENMINKKIVTISREDVESDFLLKEAKSRKIALLVPGDPLTATTHVELMIGAKENGVGFDVVHSSSIYTAVAETGLQIYKFGRTTTLPKMDENFKPTSPMDVIRENLKSGLHSLILLDIGMTAVEGLKMLETQFAKNPAVVCCKMGLPDKIIRYGTLGELAKGGDLDKTPSVIIIPGKIHFKEEEALQIWM